MKTAFEPSNYRISIAPDLSTFRFAGHLVIAGRNVEPSDQVTLDARQLTVLDCRFDVGDGPRVCRFEMHEQAQELSLFLPDLVQGPLTLIIEYQGQINDEMAGFYRSRYKAEGEERFVAVTQFEEHDARRAFPALDHPGRKATFDIEMIVDDTMTALSNTEIEVEESAGVGKKRVRFRRTPLMSTYLLFLGVGPFEIAVDKKDSRVRAVTLPGRLSLARDGLTFGREALHYFEKYFGIPYPLGKLDLIGVPEFAFGAMENWGAITFRENLLLRYPGITSRGSLQRIYEVIAHEIAHQWFGNLVTPTDWRYVWLNESFATLFGFGPMDSIHPEWRVWEQFAGGVLGNALARDSMQDTPAIEIPGDGEFVINTSTAPIVYSKGASILRQTRAYMGEERFRAGLKRYLGKHEYGNTGSGDFWDAFGEDSDEPITDMMRTWVEQPGHPVVDVERDGDDLVLTQTRFTFLPGEYDQCWEIPIAVWTIDQDGRVSTIGGRSRERVTRLPMSPNVLAYKLNQGQTGFYRVRYAADEDLQALKPYIEDKTLGPEDRWGLQADMYAMVRAGRAPMQEYLRLLSAYGREHSYLPTSGLADNLRHAHYVLHDLCDVAVRAAGLPILEQALSAVGLEPQEGEPLPASLLRSSLIHTAVMFGSEMTADYAAGLFQGLVSGGKIHPDLLGAILRVGAVSGDAATLAWLEDRFLQSDSEQEKVIVLSALGSFADTDLIERALGFALDQAPARNKHITLAAAARNEQASGLIWPWYKEHRSELESLHPQLYERVIASILPQGALGYRDEARAFFLEHVEQRPELTDVVTLSLERLEVNYRMRQAAVM